MFSTFGYKQLILSGLNTVQVCMYKFVQSVHLINVKFITIGIPK